VIRERLLGSDSLSGKAQPAFVLLYLQEDLFLFLLQIGFVLFPNERNYRNSKENTELP